MGQIGVNLSGKHLLLFKKLIERVIDALNSYFESQIIIQDIFLCSYYFNQKTNL